MWLRLVSLKTPCILLYPCSDQDEECCCSEVVPVACELPTPVSATDVAIAVVAVAVTDAENCYSLVFNISLKN
jgi:hypothetical protein